MTRAAEHSVTWDHTHCEHEDDWCRPEATFTCQAPPDAFCLNGCQECEEGWWLCAGGEQCTAERAEQDEWKDEEDDPTPPHPAEQHCTRGHLITPYGECVALLNLHYSTGWSTSWSDAEDQYEGTGLMRVKDGPVVVIPQGDEGCTWYYEGDKAYP